MNAITSIEDSFGTCTHASYQNDALGSVVQLCRVSVSLRYLLDIGTSPLAPQSSRSNLPIVHIRSCHFGTVQGLYFRGNLALTITRAQEEPYLSCTWVRGKGIL